MATSGQFYCPSTGRPNWPLTVGSPPNYMVLTTATHPYRKRSTTCSTASIASRDCLFLMRTRSRHNRLFVAASDSDDPLRLQIDSTVLYGRATGGQATSLKKTRSLHGRQCAWAKPLP
jgi:hypothetical protein